MTSTDPNDSGENQAPESQKGEASEIEEEMETTEHSVVMNGEQIDYTATTGTLVLREKDGKAKAAIFFVAYTKRDVGDVARRPLTVSFNGGPGSSSVWLHLGALGPRRAISGDVDDPVAPPYALIDNEHSILDVTDLVFIDPVSTGFSRAAPGEEEKQFHGFETDIESVGEFIRLYISRFKRWKSPKFLVGESYGTTRAAGLAGHLIERHGLYLNGVMLISSILNFQTAHFTTGNDLPYILFLPTYTASAWYHGMLDADLSVDLQSTLREVEAFAMGEYTLALMKGSSLPTDECQQIAEKLARFTGLATDFVDHADLRVSIQRFAKELLRAQKRTLGRFDSRFTGIDRDSAGEHFDYDPSFPGVQGAYTAMLNSYIREELEFECDLPYEIMTSLYETWDYGKFQNQYVNVAETLREAMTLNPFLKVLVANGYFDLATPYFATEYTVNHLGLEESLQSNLTMTYYDAGHMMYVHAPSLVKLKDDLASFIKGAS